jgi:predicted GNAT family acetyltransferase
MEILHSDNGKKGAFYVEKGGDRLAEMTYTWAGEGMFIIDHTEVSETLKGQGVGAKLVAEAVNLARKLQVKILPLCPFAKSVFDKTAEYADVLR